MLCRGFNFLLSIKNQNKRKKEKRKQKLPAEEGKSLLAVLLFAPCHYAPLSLVGCIFEVHRVHLSRASFGANLLRHGGHDAV